jgi:hypothetical protein
MAAPFLDVDAFAEMFRPLSDPESETAGAYLEVASNWIRDQLPEIAADDPAARIVVFEVTRDALLYGDIGPFTSFSKTMGPRSRSGTIDRGSVEKFITDRHRRMLGILLRAGARGYFPRCDY